MNFTFKSLLYIILFKLTFINTTLLFAQEAIPLYKGPIPNSIPSLDEETSEINKDSVLIIHKVSRPTLSIYLPPKEKCTGAAVIICPGGGYWVLAAGHEGAHVAKRFNEMGIAAFVLKYRIPDEKTMINTSIGPLQDAQRALQVVRENASAWGIDKNRIGILGFSAGGHLASTAGTHFQKAYIHNPKKTNLRPDFMVLVYPVTTFTHNGLQISSNEKLLGKNASPQLIREFSNDLQVTAKTPPTFLVHAKDDDVKVENSLVFAEALKRNNVPVELYLYEKGGHGYGMYNKASHVLWMDLVEKWLKKMHFIN
ncbi:MAG: alpha/beta hydrolase [Flavisolibacter sp.]|jgi:acetyl esterase/lipase|nr:alpha/beta hydrolase [Flavisolibacter sp.]